MAKKTTTPKKRKAHPLSRSESFSLVPRVELALLLRHYGSQTKVGKVLGVQQSQVSGWLNRTRYCTTEHASMIVKAAGGISQDYTDGKHTVASAGNGNGNGLHHSEPQITHSARLTLAQRVSTLEDLVTKLVAELGVEVTHGA